MTAPRCTSCIGTCTPVTLATVSPCGWRPRARPECVRPAAVEVVQ
jgi:hypothetical protein